MLQAPVITPSPIACTTQPWQTRAVGSVHKSSMFAAINDEKAGAPALAPTGETLEAAEARVAASYEAALQLLQAQETDAAEVPPAVAPPAVSGLPR